MPGTSHIRVLSPQVANKIAAGEVVERPASVVKELIENAIDAGAPQVDVEITAGGRKLVSVADSGDGMNRDDALLSIEPHATSKIRDVDDIERIRTLGFRGEALAAIASVSRLRLLTCTGGEDVATEILVSGGTLQDVREAARPRGTTVEVRSLFFNVPARRKFLRTYQTELGHVRNVFTVQALSHAAVGMSLKVDGRESYRLPGGGVLSDRIRDLFGQDYLRKLCELEHGRGDVRIGGYVSAPDSHRGDRNGQFTFINGRASSAPLLHHAVREAYRTLIPADRFPSTFLCIEMDPGLIDVNVHPTKREVRFRRPSEVRDTVIEAIRKALSVGSEAVSMDSAATPGERPPVTRAAASARLQIEDLPAPRAFRYPRLPLPNAERVTRNAEGGSTVEHPPESGGPGPQSAMRDPQSPWSWCRVVGQIGSLYVVLETEDGYVLMDPHAAHERVLFERFMTDVLRGSVESQTMLIPEAVDLGPQDAARVRQNLELLRRMGFGVSEFGGDTFVVDALPAYLSSASPQILLPEVSRSLQEAGPRGGAERWREESIAQAACKAAVKARDRLTLEEIEKLVVDVSRAEMPYTCPHGRPTMIFTSFRDLNRRFGRE